jgi:hypothetical protein
VPIGPSDAAARTALWHRCLDHPEMDIPALIAAARRCTPADVARSTRRRPNEALNPNRCRATTEELCARSAPPDHPSGLPTPRTTSTDTRVLSRLGACPEPQDESQQTRLVTADAGQRRISPAPRPRALRTRCTLQSQTTTAHCRNVVDSRRVQPPTEHSPTPPPTQ